MKADILLRGYSGYNSRWALKVLDKVFSPEAGAAAVIVFFGANDACLPDRYAAFQHVPLDEYKRNLHSIFSSLKVTKPNATSLFVTQAMTQVFRGATLGSVLGSVFSRRQILRCLWVCVFLGYEQVAHLSYKSMISVLPNQKILNTLADSLHIF